ncbi:MAG: DUF2284 domain-containing protein [Proteobacteria bacterium]|nr:DUF2284 domain-containing protein [Pseudomonadota bacterium]
MISRPVKVRKIPPRIDPDQLEADLKDFAGQAREEGAGEIAIIGSAEVIFSPEILSRVEADSGYRSFHWPLKHPRDSFAEAVQAYRRGLFFTLPGAAEMPDYRGGPISNPAHREAYRRIYRIVGKIEAAAFYLGYHLALGLASGNCRAVFCENERLCAALVKPENCRYPLKSRASLEAMGIDAGAMAGNLGWKLPADRAAGFPAGLVMVA